MKNNEQNVVTENPVSILCEIRTCARLNSTDFNIKSRSRRRIIRYQVVSFEGIDNAWFVYFHDQWYIIASFYTVFKHFEIIIWLLLLAEFWLSVDLLLKSLLFLVSSGSGATPKSTKSCPFLATSAILRRFRLSLISVNVGPHSLPFVVCITSASSASDSIESRVSNSAAW